MNEFPGTLTELRRSSVKLPSLVVRARSESGLEVEAPLKFASVTVGTSPECELVIDDPKVSRRHVALSLVERGVVIRDLDSKNGTLVGNVPVIEAILPPGVLVSLGKTELKVIAIGDPTTVRLSTASHFGEAIGESIAMRALFAQLERVAASDETVLLRGESGTGKELIARAIHDASPREKGPFVVFDCGAIAPSLLESELFGQVKGAFTGAHSARAGVFEEADGGTLFLDEIGELPLDLQPKLLRALEARRVKRLGSSEWTAFDVRIIAATHRDLGLQIAAGSFREDLFYRVAVVDARLPPLRERKEDIPALVERFRGPSREALPHATVAMFQAHSWPGNIRELRNAIARLNLFPESPERAIGTQKSASSDAAASIATDSFMGLTLREARERVVEQFEGEYLRAQLKEHGGNVTRAAEAMGVSRQFAHRLLERYGLRASDER